MTAHIQRSRYCDAANIPPDRVGADARRWLSTRSDARNSFGKHWWIPSLACQNQQPRYRRGQCSNSPLHDATTVVRKTAAQAKLVGLELVAQDEPETVAQAEVPRGALVVVSADLADAEAEG